MRTAPAQQERRRRAQPPARADQHTVRHDLESHPVTIIRWTGPPPLRHDRGTTHDRCVHEQKEDEAMDDVVTRALPATTGRADTTRT
ncbi:hypothetical protein GCM10023216_15660 [Isoptericola chiayiensis]|uniref:Uncharacterized protein n=1 Tax=Isoptericola chiayiensis TaxID=579446 RepID=A0ABP8YDW5_9MICO